MIQHHVLSLSQLIALQCLTLCAGSLTEAQNKTVSQSGGELDIIPVNRVFRYQHQ